MTPEEARAADAWVLNQSDGWTLFLKPATKAEMELKGVHRLTGERPTPYGQHTRRETLFYLPADAAVKAIDADVTVLTKQDKARFRSAVLNAEAARLRKLADARKPNG